MNELDDFNFELSDNQKSTMDKLINSFYDYTKKEYENVLKENEDTVTHILRNYVTPPIKGEITKYKLKWRGIDWLVYDGIKVVGVCQRDVIIRSDGSKTNR